MHDIATSNTNVKTKDAENKTLRGYSGFRVHYKLNDLKKTECARSNK